MNEEEHTGIPAVDKLIESILKDEKEQVEYTCCGVEITTLISDNGLCPICLENI